MQKIIIIGSKGNLGSQLVKVFEAGEYDVIAWDKEDFDITDKGLIDKKFTELRPAVVINCASYNAVDKCEEDESEFELAKKINGEAVGFLAEASLIEKSLFIHFSSDYVFNGKVQGGYDEDAQTDPINNYGKSKLMGEQEIIRLSGKGLKWYLIRTSKLFGPKGESDVAKPSFFDMLLRLSKERDAFDLVDSEASCFTYTVDLAKAVRGLVESDKGYGIYHITNSGDPTWYQAGKELFRISGLKHIISNPVTSDKFPRPAKRPEYSRLNSTKFESLRDYREALEEYIKNKDLN